MKKLLTLLILMIPLTGAAMENKIKFDGENYNLSVNTENGYNYYPNGENSDNWHSKISINNLPTETNPTEASAEFAHTIQSEHPGASVLVYPEAGMVGYITPSKDFFEYNTVSFKKGKKGIDKFIYSKRFYSEENGGLEGARKAAIDFAEKNNKKYMELVDKTAPKYKFD